MKKTRLTARRLSATYTPNPPRKHDDVQVIYAGRGYTEYRLPSGAVTAEIHRRGNS